MISFARPLDLEEEGSALSVPPLPFPAAPVGLRPRSRVSQTAIEELVPGEKAVPAEERGPAEKLDCPKSPEVAEEAEPSDASLQDRKAEQASEVETPVGRTDQKSYDGPSIFDLFPGAARRCPDWRWHRARYLRAHGLEPSQDEHDRHLRSVIKFQDRLENCRTEDDFRRLRRSMPVTYEAYQSYALGSEGNRDELEARILAREPLESIANKLATTTAAVKCFQRIFFHVSDRIDARSWIIRYAVNRGKTLRDLDVTDYGTLLRHYGYAYGPEYVDELAYRLSGSQRPQTQEEVDACLVATAHRSLRQKALVATRAVSVDDPKNAVKLTQLMLRLEELEHRPQKVPPPVDLKHSMEVMLEGFEKAFSKHSIAGPPSEAAREGI